MKTRDILRRTSRQLVIFTLLGLSFGLRSVAAQGQECSDDQNVRAMNYSLYYEDFKNGNYQAAMPYLHWIIRCAPGFPTNSDRNFRRLVEAYEGIGMASEDATMQRAYLDSALYVFDTAVTSIQDAGMEADPYYWVFEKGRFVQNHAAQLPDLQSDLGAIYRQTYDFDPARLQTYYVNYIIAEFVQQDDKTSAVDFMDEVESDRGSEPEIADLLTSWRGQLFTSPEERIAFLDSQLEKSPGNAEIMADLFELLLNENYRDRVYELAPAMMAADPSARTFRLVAKMRLEDGDTEEAIRLYQESLSLGGGAEASREVYYNIGIAHQQEGRLSRSRTAFRRAIEADESYGPAYIAIGDLYVTAVQGCGSFEREDRAVYWLAADYYNRAASRGDANAASQARNRLSGIGRFMPNAEDKFFKGWTAGNSYTVDYGCYTWISETTRVR